MSPDGEAKVFRSERSDFTIKWFGVISKKIIIQMVMIHARYLELLFQSLANRQEDNESEKSPVVVTQVESYVGDASIARTNTVK